jgi:CBS domain-containing protein
MLVKNILETKGSKVFNIGPKNTVYEAIEKMASKNIGALLVMDGDTVIGIITERDYRNRVILKGRASKSTSVETIMSTGLYCVSPSEKVETCMALMTDRKVRHLPVMEDDQLKGILSIGDLVKALITKQKVEIHDLRDYITGTYPG